LLIAFPGRRRLVGALLRVPLVVVGECQLLLVLGDFRVQRDQLLVEGLGLLVAGQGIRVGSYLRGNEGALVISQGEVGFQARVVGALFDKMGVKLIGLR